MGQREEIAASQNRRRSAKGSAFAVSADFSRSAELVARSYGRVMPTLTGR